MTGSITFNGLKSDTSYDVVKRAADLAVTESRITEIRTKSTNPSPSLVPNPGSTPNATPSAAPSVTTGGTGGTQTTGQKPGETPKTTLPPEDQTIGKGTVELKIPTIVMKKIMALKAANLVEDGVEAKLVIQDGLVKVNNEVDIRRGRKLYDGDVVSFDGQELRIEK